MGRPYMDLEVMELETLFRQNLHHRGVLGEIRDELTFRETRRAKQLLAEIEGVLAGRVPVPRKPPKPDSSENQIPLLDDED